MSASFVGYCSSLSAAVGEPLIVHVATNGPAATCWVDIYHILGCLDGNDVPRLRWLRRAGPVGVTRYAASTAGNRLGPGDADVEGCGWPGACALASIPEDWPSGVYLVQFTNSSEASHTISGEVGQDALLVLRRPVSRPTSTVLVQFAAATWNAYHIWQNRNLYIGDVGDRTGETVFTLRAHRVSFERPGIGLAPRSNIPAFPPTAYMYVLPFLQWASEEGFVLDYCTGIDIDQGDVELADYRLLVTVGHDEYWSRAQRDRVEKFMSEGGNVAFFGGNLAYWQIRVINQGKVVECYKRTPDPSEPTGIGGFPLDPTYRDPEIFPEHDNSNVTLEYHSAVLRRPTTSLTGTSMRNDGGIGGSARRGVHCGAAWWWENFGGPERPALGFQIVDGDHWAFEGTGLKQGQSFGEDQKLIGFECDGIDVLFIDGRPVPTFRDGAPTNIRIIAFADCTDWAEVDHGTSPPTRIPGRMLNKAAFGGVVTMVSWRAGAMGGEVFTAPVTDWPRALVDLVDYTRLAVHGTRRIAPASCHARIVTANVLRRLGGLESRSCATPEQSSSEVGTIHVAI